MNNPIRLFVHVLCHSVYFFFFYYNKFIEKRQELQSKFIEKGKNFKAIPAPMSNSCSYIFYFMYFKSSFVH